VTLVESFRLSFGIMRRLCLGERFNTAQRHTFLVVVKEI
jgi:hypothetical protein